MSAKIGKGRGSQKKEDGSPGATPETPGTSSIVSAVTVTQGGSHKFVRLTSSPEPVERQPTTERRPIFEYVVDPHGARKPNGNPYLVDLFPNINGNTERDRILPSFTGNQLREWNAAEWRCWQLIQRWRRFAHVKIRLAHKRRLWGIYGDFLKLFKNRLKGQVHHLDRDFPPGTLPDDGSRERAYPQARHIDRSVPRPSEDFDHPVVSWTSRHRIMH